MTSRHLTFAGVFIMGCTGAFLAGRMGSPTKAERSSSPAHDLPGKSATRGSGDSVMTGKGARSNGRSSGKISSLRGPAAIAKMESVMRLSDPIERSKAWLDFVNTIDPAEFESVVASFRSHGPADTLRTEYAMLLTAWAREDPAEALAYVEQHDGKSTFGRSTILSAWAASDPEAAILWAREHHTPEGKNDQGNPWMVGVIRGIAASDPTRATQLLTEMAYSEERGEALQALLPHLLAQGPETSQKWAEALTDERLKQSAIARVADALTAKDPEGTAQWLLRNPGEAADRLLGDVVGTWMQRDDQDAIAFFESLPSGEARRGALSGVSSQMADEDPHRAAAFIEAHAADASYRTYHQFIFHSFEEAPELAIGYVSRLQTSRQQEDVYNRLLPGWIQRDPQAATNWINNNPLPKKVRARMQRIASGPKP